MTIHTFLNSPRKLNSTDKKKIHKKPFRKIFTSVQTFYFENFTELGDFTLLFDLLLCENIKKIFCQFLEYGNFIFISAPKIVRQLKELSICMLSFIQLIFQIIFIRTLIS